MVPPRLAVIAGIQGVMKSHRRGLVIVVFALVIAGLLILEGVINKREVDDYNRAQLGEPLGGHIHYEGTWTSGIACLLALMIVVIEGRALVISKKRDRAGRNEVP